MRFYDLRHKEVINCRDGERLGYICDVEFETCSPCIQNIIVPGPCKLWGILGRDQEYVIPWKCIRQIGTDVILVDIDPDCFLVKCSN